MEDGDTDGDNHSDRDSDKLGNGIVYAMRMKGRAQGFAFVLLFFCPFSGLFHPSCDKFLGVENLCRRKAAVVVYTLGKNRRICWNEAKIAIILQCRKSKTTRQDNNKKNK